MAKPRPATQDTNAARHAVEFRVRYAETDQMGVVYHSNYLIWCEIGRTELLRDLGTSYAALERQGVFLAVADASLRFHGSARYDDLIRVVTTIEEVRSRSVSFHYLIFRVAGEADPRHLVSARTTLVALDTESRPRTLPPDLLDRLGHARPPSRV